jgi:hypothetical protein
MSTPFKKRSGSTIREYNINAVVEMLKKGITEGDIMTLLAMSFCPDTRADYLNTAKEKLKMENSTSTQNDAINKCKNCGKKIPDNVTFCSKDCVEQYKKENETEKA